MRWRTTGARRRGKYLDAVCECHVLEDGGCPIERTGDEIPRVAPGDLLPGHRSTRGVAQPRRERDNALRVGGNVSRETFTAGRCPRELIAPFHR